MSKKRLINTAVAASIACATATAAASTDSEKAESKMSKVESVFERLMIEGAAKPKKNHIKVAAKKSCYCSGTGGGGDPEEDPDKEEKEEQIA